MRCSDCGLSMGGKPVCPYCEDLARMAKARARENHKGENEQAAALAGEWALPALSGSEKQIAWAETLRTSAVLASPALKTALARQEAPIAARWWIDNRDKLKSLAGLLSLRADLEARERTNLAHKASGGRGSPRPIYSHELARERSLSSGLAALVGEWALPEP